MSQWDTVIHLVAGGIAGTVAAIITCPLEVVKTRLQSSAGGLYPYLKREPNCNSFRESIPSSQQRRRFYTVKFSWYPLVSLTQYAVATPSRGRYPDMAVTPGIIQCLKYIVENEGPKALFKGLLPNLIGVAPSRAIYFCTYSQTKTFFNSCLPPDSPLVHMSAASCAGFVSCTATNPIWFVKTRLQLNHCSNQTSAIECIRRIHKKSGIMGFYKGIVASYIGISETVIHFVIYEAIKAWLMTHHSKISNIDENSKSTRDFIEFMAAGAFSKTIASCIAYPHEVVRTRLREDGNKYLYFWQTTNTVILEEGPRGLYRGLTTQLVRQIPNTAIMMATYEAIVYILTIQLLPLSVSSTNFNQNSIQSTDTEFYTGAKPKRKLD